MGFWGLPLNRCAPAQLPMGRLRWKMEHLLQVGALPGLHLSWQNPGFAGMRHLPCLWLAGCS